MKILGGLCHGPSRVWRMKVGDKGKCRRQLVAEGGVTLIELLIAMAIFGAVLAMVFSFLSVARLASSRDEAITELDGLGEQVSQRVVMDLRSNLKSVEWVNISVTKMGDPYPTVVDGWIFRTVSNEVVGYGLRPSDRDHDGKQDFIDVDKDGKADDANQDGKPDLLYRLVRVRFPALAVAADEPIPQTYKTANFQNPSVWANSNILIAEHLVPNVQVITITSPAQSFTNYNVFEFQGLPEYDAVAGHPRYDVGLDGVWDAANPDPGQGDGRVEEGELGNIQNGNLWIDHIQEVTRIRSIRLNLHLERPYRGRIWILHEAHVTVEVHPRNIRSPLT